MEKLFESYVAKMLAVQETDWKINVQDSKHSLVEDHGGKRKFSLRPDIVAYRKGSSAPIILDTKWKLIDASDEKRNYGIDQSDMYQLYAYAKKYEGCNELYLVYPMYDGFQSTEIKPFVYEGNETKVTLRAVYFDWDKEMVVFR